MGEFLARFGILAYRRSTRASRGEVAEMTCADANIRRGNLALGRGSTRTFLETIDEA